MSSKNLKFSICIPIYRGSSLIKTALESIARQDFKNYQIIIGDNNEPQDTVESEKTKKIAESFNFKELLYIKNPQNLGYPKNLINITNNANGDVLFLMAHDDILSEDSLQKTHDAFFLDENIGVVTRPYYWFIENIDKPVRAVTPYDPTKDSVIDIRNNKEGFMKIFESVGQLTGLAYMKKYLEVPFNDEIFPAHIYPFAGILRKHKCVFLKDYTVAVGIQDSQTRHISSIYDDSPTLSWLKMYDTVFEADEYRQQRDWGYEHILTNYLGLIQLKNYAKRGVFEKEVKIMLDKYPQNRKSLKLWLMIAGLYLTPRSVNRKVTDYIKTNYIAKKLPNISFRYDQFDKRLYHNKNKSVEPILHTVGYQFKRK